MLVSLDWIKDFTDIPGDLSPQELGSRFTLATAEVEGVETIGDHWKKIRVVEVLEKEKHPEADKLNLVTFKASDDEVFKVVCGASNVKIGMKTPYAPTGVTLPNGLTLEPKKIRGVLSEGMLCSEEELGFAEESEGILELPSDAPLGMDMLEYFKESEDLIIDIDNKSLTHRPDLWGHYGLAREFAAIFKNPLKDQFNSDWEKKHTSLFTNDPSPMKIKVEEDSSCLGYFGLSVDGVQVGESPQWIKRRLLAVGLRPINNIVDISNYVMLELGFPLHIFDRNKIQGDCVHIKRVGGEENFVTLDEIERKLVASDTVICDQEKPLVLAGIMGGLNSGVDDDTTQVFIETANWKAAEVRTTSTRLGLRTDSSQRYEKTLDSLLMKRTILRTLELILELCPEAKVVGSLEYDGPNLEEIKSVEVKISHEHLIKTLGHELSENEVIDILERLDFKVENSSGVYNVGVPSYRATKDIECDADIVEEIGRIVGYDNITPISPQLDITPARLSPAQELHRKIRDFMVQHTSALEINTYAMVGEKLLKKCQWPSLNEKLKLINSLSKDHDRMRDSLVPSFLEVSGLNAKNYDQFRFFELGRSYLPDNKNFSSDQYQLGIAFYDREKPVFMDLANQVIDLLGACNISADLVESHPKFKNNLVNEEWMGLHPFEFRNIRIQGKMNGVIFSVHPLMARNFKVKGHLSFAFIDTTAFQDRPVKDKVKYKPLPKFPGSHFDYTLTLNAEQTVGQIFAALKGVKIKEITESKVVDIFEPKDDENRYVTIRTHFLDAEKTLSGEFLKEAESVILSKLEKSGFPLKQG